MKPYEFADKEIKRLNKIFTREFRNFQLVKIDELNVIKSAKEMYKKLNNHAKHSFLRIAKDIKSDIEPEIIFLLLSDYDPITKYVYNHEVERKCMRFAEAYIASNGSEKEIRTSLRLWAAMIAQYSITVTDTAMIEAYKTDGVKYIEWITVRDNRTCQECAKRDGRIYAIDKIPPKPHIGCRCYFVPHRG